MTPTPLAEPDLDDLDIGPRPAPWRPRHALAWSVATAAALAVVAAVRLSVSGEPLYRGALTELETLYIGAAAGLVASVVVAVLARLTAQKTFNLVAIAVGTGGGCELLARTLAEAVAPSRAGFLAAFPLVGLLAGLVGYTASRAWAGEVAPPPDDDYSPRALLPTPALRVVLVALLFMVAAIIGSPSRMGWLVLATGVLSLLVASALLAQERRIRQLERRLRRLEGRPAGEDGEDPPSELE